MKYLYIWIETALTAKKFRTSAYFKAYLAEKSHIRKLCSWRKLKGVNKNDQCIGISEVKTFLSKTDRPIIDFTSGATMEKSQEGECAYLNKKTGNKIFLAV